MNPSIHQSIAVAVGLGYVRVSTGRQDLSVEAQTEALRRAAEFQQLGAPEIFAEPDTHGDQPFAERPQGKRLIARVKAANGAPVTILVAKLDRLGRDSVDVSQTCRLFDELGARIWFLDINVDTRTAMGRCFMQIAAAFAELELARIRERITEALAQKRAGGLLTGTVPYGWDAVPTGRISPKGVAERKLVDNPAEQSWIIHMDRLRALGNGYHSIAKDLNARNVPTKRGRGEIMKLRRPSEPETSNPKSETRFTTGRWQAGNVAKVLQNKTVQCWLTAREALNVKAA